MQHEYSKTNKGIHNNVPFSIKLKKIISKMDYDNTTCGFYFDNYICTNDKPI